jgi:hypothetical protein
MSKILLEDNNQEPKKDNTPLPNIFQGRPEVEQSSSKYPDWDIVPPDQFINPRIKQK